MSRYRSDEATIWVWDDDDRTCLRWRSGDCWDEIRQSLKAYFPRHGDERAWTTRRERSRCSTTTSGRIAIRGTGRKDEAIGCR